MDAKKDAKEFMDRADEMYDRLVDALFVEKDDKLTVPIMLYVTAKFSASVLLGLQEESLDIDLVDEYIKTIKQLMAILGDDMRVQSLKNKIEENKREMAEIKKQMEEKKKEMKALEESFLGSIYSDDDVAN